MALFLGAIAFALTGLTSRDGASYIGYAIGLLILAVIVWKLTAPVFHVRIASASGETNALSAGDETYIRSVVRAVNEAMIQRG